MNRGLFRHAKKLVVVGAVAAVGVGALLSSPAGAVVSTPITDAPGASKALPINSQVGTARLALNCTLPILGQQTLIAEVDGTFSTLVSPGQQFYFSDGKGALELPAQLVTALRLLGTQSFNASVDTFNITGNNATPASQNALAGKPLTLTNVPLPASGGAVIPIIPTGGLLKVGPFTAGASGTSSLGLGSAGGSVSLNGGIGSLLGKLTVNCAAADPAVVLAGINIDPKRTPGSAPLAPSTAANGGYPIPVAPLDHQVGGLKVPLTCTFPSLGDRTLDLTMEGDAGTIYGVGEKFYLDTSSGALDLPPALVTEMQAKYGAFTSFDTTVSEFDIDVEGATPPSINAAPNKLVLTRQSVTGKTIQLRVPATGELKVGPFTAGPVGTMKFEVGKAAATLKLNSASGSVISTLSITCAKRIPAVIIVPLVSTAAVGGVPSVLYAGSGSAVGGDIVTISGQGLGQVREVYFGDTPAPWLAPFNSGTLFVQTPPHAKGTVKVTIRALGGTSSLNSIYTFN